MQARGVGVVAMAALAAGQLCWGGIPSEPFGPGVSVFECEAYLAADGLDLNGVAPGVSARLSVHPLPAGIGCTVDSARSSDGSDLRLKYAVTNDSAQTLCNVRLLVYLDAEIDETRNTFFNESVEVHGLAGRTRVDPVGWDVDEPGYRGGTILGRLQAGCLANSNRVASGAAEDVAMALAFDLGNIRPGYSASAEALISVDSEVAGGFFLQQKDSDPRSATVLTFSGQAVPALAEYTLTVAVDGQGRTSTAGGTFDEGARVSVCAVAAPCWEFAGWIGDAPVGLATNNPLQLTMDSARTVVAHFLPDEAPPTIQAPVDVVKESPADTSPQATGWATGSDQSVLPAFAGHFYAVVDAGMNVSWSGARAMARARGADLAVVTSAEEDAFLAANLAGRAWLGATDAAAEGPWQWVGGAPMTNGYSAWLAGHPTTGDTNAHGLALCPPGEFSEAGGEWVDLPVSTEGAVRCFVVEYTAAVSVAYSDRVSEAPWPGVLRRIARVWQVEDLCGNSATATQTIDLVDTTAPVLLGVPEGQTVEAGAIPAAPVVTATDNSGATVAVVLTESLTNQVNLGHYDLIRTWTAVDASGNSANARQTLNVRDTTAPVLAGIPPDQTVEAGAVPAVAVVTASDNSGRVFGPFFRETTNTVVAPGSFELWRSWSAWDESGNTNSALQVITVVAATGLAIRGIEAQPDSLWPPDHGAADVTLSVALAEGVDPRSVTFAIAGVSADEEIHDADWAVTGPLSLRLRAERSPFGDGRVYTVTVTCHDPAGSTATGTVAIAVPRTGGTESKLTAADTLRALQQGADKKLRGVLKPAIDHIERSLDPDYWVNENTLTDKGQKVFEEEGKAAHELMKLTGARPGTYATQAVVQAAVSIYQLVVVDDDLALAAIERAQQAAAASGCFPHSHGSACRGRFGNIDKARDAYAQALDLVNARQYEKAIERFKMAWHFAHTYAPCPGHSGCHDSRHDSDDDDEHDGCHGDGRGDPSGYGNCGKGIGREVCR